MRIVQPTTRSMLGVYDSRLPLARYNSFYHPFYLGVMQGKIPGPLPLFCTVSLGMAWVYHSYETSQYPIYWHASFIDPPTHNDKSYFLFNVDSLPCIRPTPVS